jgi:hypothetical protein
LKKVIPVGVKGEKGIIEIPLKDAVGAIHWAIGDGINHMIPAADMMGGSRTGLQTSPIKMGDEEIFFSKPHRIGHRKKPFDQGLLILNPFDRNIGQGFKNGFRNRILFGLFIKINSFNLEGEHHSKPSISNAKSNPKPKYQMS